MRTTAWPIAALRALSTWVILSLPDCAMETEVPEAPRLWRFSSEMLPQRDRVSAFREDLARQVLTMDVVDHSGGRPRIDVTYMGLGQAAACSLVATPAEFIRDRRHIKDGTDNFFLTSKTKDVDGRNKPGRDVESA